jgi:hypothetical protein
MWARFVRIYVTTLYVGILAIFAFIVAVDPYDSGRFGIEWPWGMLAEGGRFSNASRGRDQRFDSAIIGNSHSLPLDPERLSAGSGRLFVKLSVIATGPLEQLAVFDWFLRHHARPGAIVLVADTFWCSQDPPSPIVPFPFWLYGKSNLAYLGNLLRLQALDYGWRRVRLALGWAKPNDPLGESDYELTRNWHFRPELPPVLSPASVGPRTPERSFPSVEQLKEFLPRLPPQAPLIIVYPPVFVTALPTLGSPEAERLAECKGALARLVGSRGAFLDFAVDGEVARDPRNFMDATHYREGVARDIEQRILAALANLPHR